MKHALTFSTLLALSLASAFAQEPPALDPAIPALPEPAPPSAPSTPADEPPPATETAPLPVDPTIPGTTPDSEEPAGSNEIQESDEGYLIKDAPLNDMFQFLAKQAGRQYFHNAKLLTPEFKVTGHLNDGDPLQQMEELAFMYGLTLYTKGSTIYALSSAQLSQLPSSEFHYQLRYLRSADIEQIKALVQPMLTPGTGIVNFEPKTNTIVIIDTAHRIEQAKGLLSRIDQAKGQIVVETKILRINSSAAERVGINWSDSLGESGASIEIARSLNSIFGIDTNFSAQAGTTGESLAATESAAASNLVLSPMQLNGVLRALAEGNFATQVSSPTLITEDNEQGSISIIDRIPIITKTQSGSGDTAIATEEVRYKIDSADKAITEDANNHREVGISVVVTPTLLPDGTIRMKLRPRSAQISGTVQGAENSYPRVTESMVESLSRIPDGHSLVVGGFYGELENKDRSKIPLLGDLPMINFFFKSKETIKENASLVFIVTPTAYDPASTGANQFQSDRIQRNVALPLSHDWVDPEQNPGPAHEPDLQRTLRGFRPQQTPNFPEPASKQPKERFSRVRK
ncbi:MAG: hypothetical protein EAZ65_02510 [Verrucomicrobia bacterium]|nr:MAG: hypothetical protein EAZ84_04770 [Verrucomicrobiota bacterium]TAE88873.1 MAG: hypothetical protein EAZ82_02215 [Verrucomicrobiota bacterium]TAF27290.1 MAG: hypothetical protein EAZ71_02180 [Verrucomicrobiota bacterium]TAF42419.1 MAG: hypothetical protein EAZ65_02510 [Verrucomicrobiota bacterium]